MVSFFVCLAILLIGYIVYGRVVEKVFGPEINRPTPAIAHSDGIDYIPMKTWKSFLIQLLNIAGLAPIFGGI